MSEVAETPSFTLASPAGGVGAIAVIELRGCNEAGAARLALPRLAIGEMRLADLLGVDRGVVYRLGEQRWLLTPHGGAAVVAGLIEALRVAGLMESEAGARLSSEQLSRGTVDADIAAAELRGAIARAASPLAIDLLIEQPRRWAEPGASSDPSLDRIRNRLIEPPTVAAVGGANIGKSSLLNALAGRDVSLVADEPGTTRDHVGALIDMGGLVVRYIDTPGLRAGSGVAEAEAVRLAIDVAEAADLVLLCCDHATPFPEIRPRGPTVRVGLRGDLGPPAADADLAVSALTGQGVSGLVAMVRERLAPREALADPRPWRFWDA